MLVPEWATEIETERPRVIWFYGCNIEWHPKWPGVVVVTAQTPAQATFLIDNYKGQIWDYAKKNFAGFERILIKPEHAKSRDEEIYWCHASGMYTTQKITPDERAKIQEMLTSVGITIG